MHDITIDLTQAFSPQVLFDPARNRGCLYNPATRKVEMHYPAGSSDTSGYRLHPDSILTDNFSAYLRFLAEKHLLFDVPQPTTLVEVSEDEGPTSEDYCETGFSVYSTVMLRKAIYFDGLPSYFDTIGFSFLDGALFAPIYCEVIESSQFTAHPCGLSSLF